MLGRAFAREDISESARSNRLTDAPIQAGGKGASPRNCKLGMRGPPPYTLKIRNSDELRTQH